MPEHPGQRLEPATSDRYARSSFALPVPTGRMIRRTQLRQLVPLADTTIYEMEQRGDFPRRFNLSPRCVVWDLAEVQNWVAERRSASNTATNTRAAPPDVRQRRTRPVKAPGPR